MAEEFELPFSAESFAGKARLFPVPGLVLFPHVVQALHIFESRYREMVEDALAGDQLIAIGLLSPGYESDYDGRPPVESVVCLGRVVTHERQNDGRYNILVVGLCRAEIIAELPALRSFREVEVRLLTDVDQAQDVQSQDTLRVRLRDCLAKIVQIKHSVESPLDELLDRHASLAMLTDLLSYSAPLDVRVKQTLLGEVDVQERARRLLKLIGQLPRSREDWDFESFPPDFSAN